MSEGAFSVVIPTLKRPEELRRTLGGVLACDPLPAEIVIVDGDPDGSARPVVDELIAPDKVTIRHLGSAPGLTIQRNNALEVVTSPNILFIDDDVDLDPATFRLLAEAFEDPSVVGVTARVIEAAGRDVGGMHSPVRRLFGRTQGSFTSYGYPNRIVDTSVPRDVELMYGCFMAVRTDEARRVRFDENLPGYGLAEDEDFAYRLSRRGRVAYRPEIVVQHLNLGFRTMDRRGFSKRVVINREYLFRKNFPQTLKARAGFRGLLVILFAHRLVNRDIAGARGIIDGIRAVRRARS